MCAQSVMTSLDVILSQHLHLFTNLEDVHILFFYGGYITYSWLISLKY